MTYPVEGGCDCRHIRYRLSSAPLVVHCCHCRWCQRESGAAFALDAMYESDRLVNLEGAPAFPGYYDREAVWSAEALARRRAILPRIEAYLAGRG